SGRQAGVGGVRAVLGAATAAVALLLRLAGVNGGSLILVRVTTRAHEIAVRHSLGASAGDIVRHLLAESGSLVVAGGVLGYALAGALIRVLLVVAPAGLPQMDAIRLGGTPVVIAVA